ncbi:hypothetical protein [Streptomyces sp. NPDC057496]
MNPDFRFDFTHLGADPVALLPEAGPDRPSTILPRRDDLLPVRWGQLTD